MSRIIRFVSAMCIAFIVSSLVIHTLFSFISLKSGTRYSRLYAGKIEADILILGNSRGVNSIYTPYLKEKYNISAFNLSYNGLSIGMFKPLLEDYLLYNLPPKTVFMEVSNFSLHYDNLKDLKLYRGISGNLDKILKEQFPVIYYITGVIPLFRYNSEYFLRNLYYWRKNDQNWINRYTITEEYYRSFDPGPNIDSRPHTDSFDVLSEFISFLYQNGIEPVAYISPLLPQKAAARTLYHGHIKEELNHRFPQMTFLDYSAEIDEYTAFADSIHLNETGAIQLLDKMVADQVFDNWLP